MDGRVVVLLLAVGPSGCGRLGYDASSASGDGGGDSSDGRIADASTNGGADAPADASPNEVVELAAGGGHTCARLASGDAWCWGRTYLGRMGDGTLADGARTTP